MKKWTITLLALTLTMGLSQAKPSQSATADGWEKLETPDGTIRYPSNWTATLAPGLGLQFAIFNKSGQQPETFRANFSFMVQDLRGMDLDLKGFVDLSIKQVETLLGNGELLQCKRVRKSGLPCQMMFYTYELMGQSLKIIQYIWVVDERAYLLSFIDQARSFDQKLDLAERVLDSFQLKHR